MRLSAFYNVVMFGIITASLPSAFADCTSGPLFSNDGTQISVSINQDCNSQSANPTINVNLSPAKCSAQSVQVTMIENSNPEAPPINPNNFLVTLLKDPNDPCHFSGSSSTRLILSNGEEVNQAIAVRVSYSDNANDWLGTKLDPWHPNDQSHNFSYSLR